MWGFTKSSCSYRIISSAEEWKYRLAINTVATRSNMKAPRQQQQVSLKSLTSNASSSSTIAQEQDITFDQEYSLRIRIHGRSTNAHLYPLH